MLRTTLMGALLAMTLTACSGLPKVSYNFDWGSQPDLYLAEDRDKVTAVARDIMEEDYFMTFVTTDKNGYPRARTIEHKKAIDDDLVVWFATIPGTRKLEQIRANPKVTLYFDAPDEFSYVTLMGRATIHEDAETAAKVTWRDKASRDRFWPNFPENYVLIRIEPDWIEVVAQGKGVDSRDKDWRPQAVVFD